MRRRRDDAVVGANEDAADEIPVVKPVRPRHGDDRRMTLESPLDALQPLQRRAAVGIDIRQHVAGRMPAPGFAGNDQPFHRFVDDANAGYRGRNGACVV